MKEKRSCIYYEKINNVGTLYSYHFVALPHRPSGIENYISEKEQTNSQMKRLISILLVLSLLLTMPTASAGYMHITQTTMEFEGADAVFTLDYDLDLLARIYVMAFGSAKIVPDIMAQFASFDGDDVAVRKLDYKQAIVVVQNVSHYDGGYYFHNSYDFGMTIEKLVVDPPDGSPRTYRNTSSTPNIFYADVWG